ncbi:MAG TPA: LCP family protein [Rhodoglobus sp.]|nr:LCP family protein [Rhodoglobus sp.]HOT32839.1 LCP family protein [Rhodoglobus sp.]HQE47041.1 LCP family protein [Rhodoglobus sp.]HQI64984.1 LCP family protein [Rhodoglobus sp.]HQJ33550.1 LCP family protein [Rhodoglobus sp.]
MTNASSPVRYPNTRSPEVMTRRAWVLVVLNILIPGSAQLLAGSRRLGRFGVGSTFVLWGLIAIGALVYFLGRTAFITIATNSFALWVLQGVIIFYVVLWVVLTLDTLRLVRFVNVEGNARIFVAVLSVAALVVVAGTGAYAVMIAGTTRSTVGEVFAGTTIEPPVDGRYNILLLGGDAGPDRDGLRPDSISVVSVEASTGKATIIGVPRNMEDVPFVEGSPLAAEYPDGYGVNDCQVDVCLINSIYTEVELYSPDLYPDAVANGSQPGIEAMRDAVEGTLGITIQYYALIDMQGFADLIDALGGVTIDVAHRLPITDEVDENGQPYTDVPWIEPGVQLMGGGTALAYARIRAGTTDYERMGRQRQVQEAILQQFDPANVLTKFQAVAQAGAQVVSTDIPQSMLGYFVELAGKSRELPVDTLDLVPDNGVDPEYPDFDYIRQLVAEALAPTVEETPAP